MAGLFGSVRKAAGGFNRIDPESNLSWADRVAAIGGVLQGDTGAASELRQLATGRQKMAALKAAQASLDGFLGGEASDGSAATLAPERAAQPGTRTLSVPELLSANGPQTQAPPQVPRVPTLREALPALLKAQAAGLDISGHIELLKAARPDLKYFNTSDAIVGVDPATNSAMPLYRDAPKAPTAPIGYRWVGDTLVAIPGGPADPKTVGALSGVRRDAVISRPTPSRARIGAGGMKLPAGFVLDGK